jgi:alpha-mannosidase
MQVAAHAGTLQSRHSFVALGPENVVLTAVKKAEDSNALILRFYEWEGKDGCVRLRIPKGATAAHLANLLEQQQGAALSIENDETVTVPTHPHEIVTVNLDYAVPAQ